ncbi:efflux RND transporter permease subunit [Gloeobacter kilaueensis]|uniref:Transporter, hydrophobe/amphiphile efflux-1 (HAE1) family n=1 Tax=Gloeobacter kilaueensis (strain ATCC BAA-2537 / CCAP 1431/1 / ULC 316 / JS1) TaxID=1183438 RepID=U5QK47_GLOK1|nr:efflux RND transporter permease subunit [Gloeobacter kilaueensis]AGY58050.1 transporter, hydrophobe/amphiphile efflux-1 (HAE1) family [Gloeobacter kilaueensis JS1]
MFVDFFIRRPIFAGVCAVIILLAGAVAIPSLPIAQYPEISPPQVTVSATYVGASSQVVEETVTTILERAINGVEGMRYIDSNSSDQGVSTIVVTFELDRDKDIAAVDVQNRISTVLSQLPSLVQQTGVSITKTTGAPLLGMGFYSDKGEYSNTFLSNYADLYLVDALKRVEGVGDVRIFGERRYSMRLWLDPNRLASRNLTAQDVVAAISEQNQQVGAGQIGQPPIANSQSFQVGMRVLGRLAEPDQFGDMVIKTNPNGSLVRLRDVGRVELGAENYNSFLRFRGQDGVGLGVYPIPGSNALDIGKGVKARMAELQKSFPPGVKYRIAFDTTDFIQESAGEVVKTLIEAIVLVVIVMFVFLQDWKATLIPAITIPVSLVGTFIFVKLFGFSINSLTLFGLTLATGLVVDDAIVVIENIARTSKEQCVDPKDCASEAMREVTAAVIAIALVLMAVFIPVAFFPGTTGQLYKQFALTIAFSIIISTFNALTLTPALAALLSTQQAGESNFILFRWFNAGFERFRNGYAGLLERLTRVSVLVILGFVALLGVTGWLFLRTPSAFLPEEDQGYFITLVQAPEGVSINYTSDVMRQVEKLLLKQPEVEGTFAVGGFGFNGSAANSGVIFTTLKPWSQRHKPEEQMLAFINRVRGPLLGIKEAIVVPFNAPAIQGLSTFGGFTYELQDKGNNDIQTFASTAQGLVAQGNQTPGLQGLFTTFNPNSPQLLIEVDRARAKSLNVSLSDIFNSLQTYLGSRYVNDFNLFGRSYRVYVQADEKFRSNPRDIRALYVRSQSGSLVSLGELLKITPTTAPSIITHFNLFRSIEISGNPAPGYSSGQALASMEKLSAQNLPATMGFEWKGISLEEKTSGGAAPLIFALGIVFVYLVLAAQYESLVEPFIILLAVPLAVLGALVALTVRGFPNDVYTQIGLVMLIGLASKNSILIVEFANQARERGLGITKAALEAASERLRPILMTSFAFILGTWPLVVAEGAGAASRQSLGTAVVGGMVISTFLSLFVVPVLYIVIVSIRERVLGRHSEPQPIAKAQTPAE